MPGCRPLIRRRCGKSSGHTRIMIAARGVLWDIGNLGSHSTYTEVIHLSNVNVSCRIRISLRNGELEVEGSEAFLKQHDESIRALVHRLEQTRPEAFSPLEPKQSTSSSNGPDASKNSFPEALQDLPQGAPATDQILLAGFYAAQENVDNTFSTGAANSLLIEQGIKLSNPSQSLTNNLKAKRVFRHGKFYKVSKGGEEHLQSLGVIA